MENPCFNGRKNKGNHFFLFIQKTNEKNLTRLSRSLLKTFLLILKTISPEEKVQLFSRFIQSPDYENDTCIVLWFPIVIEVCIPFLKDDNRYFEP